MSSFFVSSEEFIALDGATLQNPQNGVTGAGISISSYKNRLFGSPFQLLDSVDVRSTDVNPDVGNEYLKNFLLNSPILYIRPGRPYYTGTDDVGTVGDSLDNIISDAATGNLGLSTTVYNLVNMIFRSSATVTKRFFSFKEDYLSYTTYVDHMCRTMATFLSLTDSGTYPNGIFDNTGKFSDFATMKWANYSYTGAVTNSATDDLWDIATGTVSNLSNSIASASDNLKNVVSIDTEQSLLSNVGTVFGSLYSALSDVGTALLSPQIAALEVLTTRNTSVMFMVEPGSYEETFSNSTRQSAFTSKIDELQSGIGSEIAFMTNSSVSPEIIEEMTNILDVTSDAATLMLDGLTGSATSGFVANLFNGAVDSLKGQKMLYPEIYESSSSKMTHTYTCNIDAPYGDIYNYYTELVVPLCHWVCLAAPRMVSANTTTSPFLVQAFIPGMSMCELGIIESLVIRKNPSGKRVSVNGFPLSIQIQVTIKELYNSVSISPHDDPASFLYNDSLNSYMATLAGLSPSEGVDAMTRSAMVNSMADYVTGGGFIQDAADGVLNVISDWVN